MNRALLVGINTYPSAPLNGCVNDVTDMADFLVTYCGFQKNEIRLLVNERATKLGILERIGWLLTGVQPGDRIFFHYSGHGVQLPTRNPQGEVDGLDEAICPYDFNWTDDTTLRDKDFKAIFSTIPEGVLFTWVADSCHSEDVHRFFLKPNQKIKTIIPPADIAWRMATAIQKGLTPMGLKRVSAEANVLLVSGCKSDELSADAFINKKYNGALTFYLLKYLTEGGLSQQMTTVVSEVNRLLDENNYDQNPQLNGSEVLKQKAFLQ